MMYQTDDVRINKIKDLLPPIALLERFPASEKATSSVV
ncbi:MAG: 3-deoxy-7-phosphoheptulonate synthase, partial [Colwellia sp.]|nr:3-deoxy-7-phosphoheptulonate synthase [Colwellia sp.]